MVSAVTIRGNGDITFNDTPVSLEQVERYVRTSADMTPQPFITVDFRRGTDCTTINRVRRVINRSFDCVNDDHCLQGPPPEWATR